MTLGILLLWLSDGNEVESRWTKSMVAKKNLSVAFDHFVIALLFLVFLLHVAVVGAFGVTDVTIVGF
jgi:hypothetical protein